jgi:hypothetical protein
MHSVCCGVSLLLAPSKLNVRAKQCYYRPGQTLTVPGRWGCQISRQSAPDGGIVSPTHRPPLPPRKYSLVLIYVRGWVNPSVIVRPEGLCQWKIPLTLSGIEPATFRLVASTNCATAYPRHLPSYLPSVQLVCAVHNSATGTMTVSYGSSVIRDRFCVYDFTSSGKVQSFLFTVSRRKYVKFWDKILVCDVRGSHNSADVSDLVRCSATLDV